jgi:hypothetical protein
LDHFGLTWTQDAAVSHKTYQNFSNLWSLSRRCFNHRRCLEERKVVLLPSIHDHVRSEEGGPAARQGFAFQDRVAAKCCLEMLKDDVIVEVWCETYDDIVILRRTTEEETVEYVQVKNEQPDQLWTLAMLYARDGRRCGTSVFEKSLARDCFKERALFRIVTSQNIHSKIALLALPREHVDRASSTSWFREIVGAIHKALPDARYVNNKDCSYWLARMLWEVNSDNEVDCENKVRIHKVLEQLGFSPSSDLCDEVYEGLLALVKNAAEHPWTEREKRKIRKESLKARLRDVADPFPDVTSSERLTKKMEQATPDGTYIENAQTLAREFRRRFRESPYIKTLNRGMVEAATTMCLHNLRVRLDSGEIKDTAFEFYCRCVAAIKALANSSSFINCDLGDDFFAGCMYEITARCGHRFTKIIQ